MKRTPWPGSALALAALAALALAPAPAPAATAARRPMALDDLAALRDVGDPQVSPEGDWVAYTVRTTDLKEDRRTTNLWMTSWDGSRTRQLTFTREGESAPRFSPEGRWLSFLAARGGDDEKTQLWLLERAGGEAEKITSLKGDIGDYAWSPDGRRIVLVVRDPDPAEPEKNRPGSADASKKTPRPIVIDRFQFKRDEVGYLGERRQHLALLDVATRRVDSLTTGRFNEYLPSWSPDGSRIAFVSNHSADIDRTDNFDLFVIDARPGARPRQLTTYSGADCAPEWGSRPAWSPDGRSIAYPRGGRPELIEYGIHQLAVIPASGGAERLLAPQLDRNVASPRWSADGRSIWFLLEDDRAIDLARIPAAGGTIERVASGSRTIDSFDLGAGGRLAVRAGGPLAPAEVFALDGGALRALSTQNAPLLARLALAPVEETRFRSRDGTEIHGFLVRPAEARAGRRVPTLLRMHGGPQSQFLGQFSTEWQLFAAAGYAVVAANPRGSSGRGEAFCKAIYADWGDVDAQDVLAAVDDAVARGIADPNRLGVGGWSYGGMLTNYVIAQDTRFRAATSGASISNILAGYGTDQYVRDYEYELGRPWEHPEVWTRISFPFYHADRIVTPTLFLCGEKDFNVPLLNSEQMYQALRSLGRDTRLIIYPGQFHGIGKPSYVRDRMQRYLDWYATHLRANGGGEPRARPAAAATH